VSERKKRLVESVQVFFYKLQNTEIGQYAKYTSSVKQFNLGI